MSAHGIPVNGAKTIEPMPFGGDSCGPKKPCIGWVHQIPMRRVDILQGFRLAENSAECRDGCKYKDRDASAMRSHPKLL